MGCLMDVPHQSRLVDLLIGRIEIVFPSNWTSSLPFKYPQTSLTSTFLLSFHVCTYKSVSQLLCNHLRKNSGKFSQPQVPFLKMVKHLFYHSIISSFYARCKCSSTKSVLFPKVHAHKKILNKKNILDENFMTVCVVTQLIHAYPLYVAVRF